MGPIDALGHLLNLLMPAIGVAFGLAWMTKLAWRAELTAVPWIRLFATGTATGIVAVLMSLLLFGRDGSLAGYALLVTSCALSQWWLCFGPGRH